jgi:diaminopimelate epimerase
MYDLEFFKYTGAGNDFIMIDDRTQTFPLDNKDFIKHLCHRQNGIGADGIILMQRSLKADLRFRIFNSDASEAEMCGNGMRCFGAFAQQRGIDFSSLNIETMQNILKISKKESYIEVQMADPKDEQLDITLMIHGNPINLSFINTSVPHAVIFVKNVASQEVQTIGRAIRFDPYFDPKGTNVNFVEILDENTLSIRTYERGVESETLACGTGATAAALLAFKLFNLKNSIYVKTKNEEFLNITFEEKEGVFNNIKMSGPAKFIFQGIITY